MNFGTKMVPNVSKTTLMPQPKTMNRARDRGNTSLTFIYANSKTRSDNLTKAWKMTYMEDRWFVWKSNFLMMRSSL